MAAQQSTEQKKSIVFLHPDLGIGGAERLVIDAAVGLQSLGHKVTIFTSHCDPSHCFTEARDGTLDVRVRGNTIVPQSIFGRFSILCAILRQLHLVVSIAFFSSELNNLRPTDLFIDQLSACVPLLRIVYSDARILFYCHFPDQLLVQKDGGLLGLVKNLYRIPFNWLESWSTSCGDMIVVNSRFTGGMVKTVFPSMKKRTLKIVYPCVDTTIAEKSQDRYRQSIWPNKKVLLSINRFERKKDVALAIKAFAGLDAVEKQGVRLVIAGGYDMRIEENVSYHEDLKTLASSLDLSHATFQNFDKTTPVTEEISILFLLSVSETLKQSLLDSAMLLIYTPQNEHFGIVPLEAMLNGVPVLAANQGGPLETVLEGRTGWLRDVKDVTAWTAIMSRVVSPTKSDPVALAKMSEAGRSHVTQYFSKEMMARRIEKCLDDMKSVKREPIVNTLVATAVFLTVFATVLGVVLTKILFWALDQDTQMEAHAEIRKASQLAKQSMESVTSTVLPGSRNEL